MTIDEAIKHAEEVAEENEKFCYKKGGEGGYFNEDIDWDNVKCAEEHRQLAEWLKELKTHREAWEKVECMLRKLGEVNEISYYSHQDDNWFDGIRDAIKYIKKYRPKEGDSK